MLCWCVVMCLVCECSLAWGEKGGRGGSAYMCGRSHGDKTKPQTFARPDDGGAEESGDRFGVEGQTLSGVPQWCLITCEHGLT